MANRALNATITIGGAINGSLNGAIGGARRKLGELGASIRDLERDQKRLGKSMNDALQNNRAVGNMRREYDELGRKIDATREKQERLNRAVQMKSKGSAMMGSGGIALGAAAAAAAAATIPVRQAADFETAMLGVAKQVDGARSKSGKLTAIYYDMAGKIQQLGREVPVATNELAKMAEQGARMGIGRKNLVEFTRSASRLAIALDLPREELADNMGKIANLYKIPVPQIERLGDAINFLDDNAISKGGDIIDFLTRTGGVAGSVKVTANQMAALGSTLLSLGERGETASTATNSFFQKLAAADKGTKKFRGAMDEIGISTNDVMMGMQKDAQGTVLRVLDAVGKLPKEKRLGVLVDMVGLEHSDTIAKLATNMGEYRKQIDLVGSQKAKGSVGREFSATLQTTNAQLEIAKNRAMEMGVNIGSVLLPPLNSAMKFFGGITTSVAEFAREHPRLVKNIVALGGVFGGIIGVLGAVAVAVGAVTWAMGALGVASLMNPVGLAIAAIAAGAALIIANWDVIVPFFKNLWASVTASATAAMDWIMRKIAAVGDAWRATKEFFGFGGGDVTVTPRQVGRRQPPPPPPMAGARGGRSMTDQSTHAYYITPPAGTSPKAIAKEVTRQRKVDQRFLNGSALFDRPRGQ